MKPLPFCLIAGALALGACNVLPAPQSDPTRYFVLSNPSDLTAPAARAGGAEARGLRVGLSTVHVASYLNAPEMVVRRGSNEIELLEFDRWGESLDAGITRILREQLGAAPAIAEVVTQPFPLATDLDYVIEVDVLHCEGSTGGPAGRSARFEAVIRITTDRGQPQLVLRKVFSAPALAWDGRSYGDLAAALSQDVAELGREIIASLPPPS